MDPNSQNPAPSHSKREESAPKNLGDNLPYRIKGLEQAKNDPGMTPADIAALDRVIAKLKEKLASQAGPKKKDI